MKVCSNDAMFPGLDDLLFSWNENFSTNFQERAAQTNNFVYVKIPEIPICFSYKVE
jgi:hypothetical protein